MVNDHVMKDAARELRLIIDGYVPKFHAIPGEIFFTKPMPHKWSKQEVLGHLVDSAQNNLRRFICGQPPLIVYQQDFWVSANQYQKMEKADLIQLWQLLNLRIQAVLHNMPEENYSKECNTGSLRTLSWLAEDYVKHMKHHINQIITGSFDVIYV
jgi:hypothetical protein